MSGFPRLQRVAFRSLRGPLQHLQVAIRVAESKDWVPTNESVDADRFARAVVDELDFRFFEEQRLAVVPFVFDDAAATDDLLRRNSVRLLNPRPHEFDTAARDDERLKSIRAQVF